MTTSGCSKKKKKTKQKNTLRAITDNADSKRERDKKLGSNLNYFFMKPQVNKLLSLLSVTKKQKQNQKEEISHYVTKKKIEISQI